MSKQEPIGQSGATTERSIRLRSRAEQLLSAGQDERSERDFGDMAELVHELEVYQMELELQNEELRRSQAELETSRDRYVNLYDAAPVGYLTVDRDGLIEQANLTAAAMLDLPRGELLGSAVSDFVFADDQDIWYLHRQAMLSRAVDPTMSGACELSLATTPPVTVLVQSRIQHDDAEQPTSFAVTLTDITARRSAEVALSQLNANLDDRVHQRTSELAESERRFRSMADATPAFVWMSDPTGNLTYINEPWAKFTGCPVSGDLGSGWMQRVHPDDLDDLLARFYAANQLHKEFDHEYRVLRHDGEYRWHFERAVPRFDYDQTFLGFVGILLDGTERKAAEDALRQSETRYRSVVESIGDALLVFTLDGRFVEVNKAGCKIHGYTRDEFLALPPTELIPAAWHADFAECLREIAAGRSFLVESQHFRKDGATIDVDVHVVPFEYLGQPHALAVVRDLTARKQAEQEAREHLLLNQSILQTTIDGYVLADTEGNLRDVNSAYCQIIGYSRDELLTMNIRQLECQLSEEQIKQRISAMIRDGGARFETKHRHHDGREIELDVSIATLPDSGSGQMVAGFMRDITERKRTETALRESEERYRAAAHGGLDSFYSFEYVRNADGTIVDFRFNDVNQHGADMINMTPGQIIGQKLCELLPINRTSGFFDKYLRVFETGQPLEEEVEIDAPNIPRWIHHLVVPLSHGVAITSRDITERKLYETALRDSEAQNRRVVENSQDIIWEVQISGLPNTIDRIRCGDMTIGDLGSGDLTMVPTFASPAVESILGFTPEEAIARPFEEKYTAESCARVNQAMLEMIAEDVRAGNCAPKTVEVEEIHKDGSIVITEVKGQFIRNESGQPIGLAGISRDISEHRHAESQRDEALTRFESIANNIPDCFWVSTFTNDGEDSVDYVSPAFRQIWGYEPDDIYRNPALWTEPVVQEDGPAVAAAFEEVKRTGKPCVTTYRIRSKDGSLKWIEDQMGPRFDSDGQLIGLEGVSRDITARKLADQALSESEEKYRLLVESSPYCIYQIDLNGRLISMNRAGLRMMNVQQESMIIGMLFVDVVHQDDQQRIAALLVAAIQGQAAEFEFRSASDDCYQSSLVPIYGEDLQVTRVMGMCLDVSQRKAIERLAHRNERLAALGIMATGIAHEINNPLGSALLSTETAILRLENGKSRDQLQKCLDNSIRSLNRCSKTVESVLRFSRNEPLNLQPGDINAVVKQAVSLASPMTVAPGCLIDLQLTEPVPVVALSVLELESAVYNVLRNAIESNDHGVVVHVLTGVSDDSVWIRIVDNGRGMTNEEATKVFDPFYTTRGVDGGAGIGMSVVHKVTIEHHGEIKIESAVGVGTTVEIRIPVLFQQ
jgi:PAS domain S-box-containing protein